MTQTDDAEKPTFSEILRRLAAAVDALETAVQECDVDSGDDSRKLMQARAETEALRELHEAVTVRLESAIARLRDAVGD